MCWRLHFYQGCASASLVENGRLWPCLEWGWDETSHCVPHTASPHPLLLDFRVGRRAHLHATLFQRPQLRQWTHGRRITAPYGHDASVWPCSLVTIGNKAPIGIIFPILNTVQGESQYKLEALLAPLPGLQFDQIPPLLLCMLFIKNVGKIRGQNMHYTKCVVGSLASKESLLVHSSSYHIDHFINDMLTGIISFKLPQQIRMINIFVLSQNLEYIFTEKGWAFGFSPLFSAVSWTDSFLTYLVSITETDLQYSVSVQMKHFNTLDGSFLLADRMAWSEKGWFFFLFFLLAKFKGDQD